MSVNRWQVHRAGILNYWYYDEAEFLFAGGRLMLRGSNGSGKSVTMQSLVTVLLDGVTQARRLDSFGSQSRRIEDYLLGEREISEVDERTGYLFFEYKREATEQYVTTGIGLHAKRGTGRVDFWGFVLENGRRVGKDFSLYHLGHDPETGKTVKIPLSRRELVHAIGADGQVVSSHSEYMALVNARVYGFRELGQYEELMRLLIQLRSPKLSRDFKPTVIYEILNASLPALTDEELRPLSETLANIEQTRLSLEQMRREEKAFSQLCQAYTAYNRSVLGKRASLLLGQRERLQAAERRLEAIGGEQKEAEALCAQAAAAQQSLTAEESRLREEQKALMSNEAFQAAEEKKQRLDERAQLAKRREQKADDYAAKRRRELTLTEDLRKAEAACEALRRSLRSGSSRRTACSRSTRRLRRRPRPRQQTTRSRRCSGSGSRPGARIFAPCAPRSRTSDSAARSSRVSRRSFPRSCASSMSTRRKRRRRSARSARRGRRSSRSTTSGRRRMRSACPSRRRRSSSGCSQTSMRPATGRM